jgi:hypothetical protein
VTDPVVKEPVRDEWRGRSLRWTLAGFMFLLVSGLVILLAPFSTGAQISVLVHTLGGIAWMVPFFIYFVPHLRRRWREPMSHLAVLGWLTGTLFVAATLTGVVLTWQAAFGRRISVGWDLVHTIAGCAAAPILVTHLVTAARRAKHGEWRFVARLLETTTAWGVVGAIIVWGGGTLLEPSAPRSKLPENYSLRYGDNPFAPSKARTDWLWRLDEDRRWSEFLESLIKKPEAERAAGIASFLEGVEAKHRDAVARELIPDKRPIARPHP